jgi:copper oxidase (laccase) domain-containing protein
MMSNFFIPDWPAPPHIKSMQTLRAGGQSQHKYNSFNLATHVNDEINAVHLNRDLLNQYLPSSPHWLNQTHSVDVLKLPSPKLNGELFPSNICMIAFLNHSLSSFCFSVI